ncbi:MAG: GNAT family N-acetyltransferase [Clostridia bacterium]|nr:GNAT family N-acetyltransferase [Clostridia bacterium]
MIITDNLIIKPFSNDMAHDVHINSLDDDVRRFVPDEVFETEEEALDTIHFLISRYNSSEGPFVYPVFLRKTDQNIGYVQLSSVSDGWEIGYHIAKPYTGCHYASEAVKAFLPFIMDQLSLSRVQGICVSENIASRHVLERCGFIMEFEGMGWYQGQKRMICKYIVIREKNS